MDQATDNEPGTGDDPTAGAAATPAGEQATRVLLSYPETVSERTRGRVGQAYYRSYLRKVLGEVAVGDEFEEFTDVGCCGSQIHLAFRVEAVEGGSVVGPETEVEYTTRPAEDGEDEGSASAWRVQNEID